MTLVEKIKSNLNFIFEKRKISHEEWKKRLEIFGCNNETFIWYGVDSEGNLAEFTCDRSSFVPESFFQDVSANKKLLDFFWDLPKTTTSLLPENLSPRLKKFASDKRKTFWRTIDDANDGLFTFDETDGDEWNKTRADFINYHGKPPYELLIIPKEALKINQLPKEIQKLLEPYHFQNLKFADCQFLDVSKYLYCEE